MKNSRKAIITVFFFIVAIAGELSYLFFTHQKEKQLNADALLSACDSSSSPTQCWYDGVEAILKIKGVDVAFEAIARLYDTEPSFAQACHSFTHRVGEVAYEKFIANEQFAVSPKTSYCGYGFYHGFMEALLARSHNFDEARKFCNYVDHKLAAVSPDAGLQCYHGIGHGSVNDHDPRDRGNERALVTPALALCEKVSATMLERYRCASGVFNGLAVFYTNGDYGLALKKDDPLWICREQKKEYREACYGNMNVALLWFTHQDFSQAARFIETIDEDDEAVKAIRYLAAPFGAAHQQQDSHTSEINLCRSLQPRLRLSCLQGFAFGMLEHGPPGNEYIKPMQLCGSRELHNTEQNACFDYLFSYLGIWYPKEKAEQICATAASSRSETCLATMRKTLQERSQQ